MYLKECDELTSEEKQEIINAVFYIHESIRTKNWAALNSGIFHTDCSPEDILYEIGDYNEGIWEVTYCEAEILAETIRPERSGRSNKWETLSLMWLNGSESDLSMMCEYTFSGGKLVSVVLEEVHVF